MVTSTPSAAAAAMMSPHRDVLEAAVPDTAESKTKLVDELKSRGKAAVNAKSWMDAKLLYEKALAVVEDDATVCSSGDGGNGVAVLASNLSLVELKMNHSDAAEAAARKATEADPTYVKAWWRLGQALIVLEKHDKALDALTKAQSLEPSNKALIKEVEKVQQTIDEMAKKKAEEDAAKGDDDVEMKDADTSSKVVVTSPPKTSSTLTKPEKNTASSTTTTTDGTDKGNDMRGYKIVNGKKTSYFHNELTEEAKKLIGDIAPKKLDNPPTPLTATGQVKNGMSVWNNAGTWEERDCTAWARESLTKALLETTYVLPASSPAPDALVTVTKVKSCDGHASVAVARGKTRFIYEWCVKIEWHLGKDDDQLECSGSLALPDIDGTIELGEGYEIHDFVVDSVSDNSVKPLVDRFVHRGGFHDAINKSIDDWVGLFKKEYGPKE